MISNPNLIYHITFTILHLQHCIHIIAFIVEHLLLSIYHIALHSLHIYLSQCIYYIVFIKSYSLQCIECFVAPTFIILTLKLIADQPKGRIDPTQKLTDIIAYKFAANDIAFDKLASIY